MLNGWEMSVKCFPVETKFVQKPPRNIRKSMVLHFWVKTKHPTKYLCHRIEKQDVFGLVLVFFDTETRHELDLNLFIY